MERLENVEVRMLLISAGANMKKLAETMGISQSALSHLLQKRLTPRSREKILVAIEQIKSEKGCKHGKKKT